MDGQERPWVVTSQSLVYHWNGSRWLGDIGMGSLVGCYKEGIWSVGAGPNATDVYRYDVNDRQWHALPGGLPAPAQTLAVDNENRPWVTVENRVYYWNGSRWTKTGPGGVLVACNRSGVWSVDKNGALVSQ